MYAPLQVLSSYSLLQSPLRISEYVKLGKELGYSALVLTDINSMYGVLDFYHECVKAGIKPIIGITLQSSDDEYIFIAKNSNGYQNLMNISSKRLTAVDENYKNIFKLADITEYLQDVIVVLNPSYLTVNDIISDQVTELQTLVSAAETIYYGVNPNDRDAINNDLMAAEKLQLETILLTPVKYLKERDYFSTKVLQAIGTGENVNPNWNFKNDGNYLHTPEEYERLGTDYLSSAYQNAINVIAQCNLTLNFPKTQLPHFKETNGLNSEDFLRKLCQEGLAKRIAEENIKNQEEYQNRLDYELSVIHRMGFDDYFLIVWDVTNFAHENNILTGPGRGSAAGSLVSYTLYITDIDPIKYDLIFERFLNEERAQMPDIDLDIPDIKRDTIIEYLHQKYGQQHMAQIITFGTLKTKQVLRDVARVFDLKTYEVDAWSKAIPKEYGITLKEAYASSQSLKNLVADNSKNRLLFETAIALEGLPRHYSTHAAGIILSDDDLVDHVPVQIGGDGILMSQFAKNQVEEVGLLKMDFLGLRNLSILENTITLIKKGYHIDFDIRKINLDDPETLKIYQNAETSGIFQFESAGIRGVLTKLKPTSFEDVAAVNALYRPGPIQNIDEFIARKHGERPITYPSKELEGILKQTYGIMVYQEQVMQVASTMGGFTLGQADLLRRAMSKKKHDIISRMEVMFINGAMKKGYTHEVAKKVYAYIMEFGDYGFNRSHAVAYSKMSFELAYIKAHYPAAFFAALLNSVIGNPRKTKDYVLEAKNKGVKVHHPDINISQSLYILRNGEIYFGLSCIKSLRKNFLQDILQERKRSGIFKNMEDFLQRINKRYLKRELIEILIYSGVFDTFGQSRKELLAMLPRLLSNIELSGNNVELFSILAPKKTTVEKIEISNDELLEKENYYLGAYLSGHPVEKYVELIYLTNSTRVSQINESNKDKYVSMILQIKVIKIIRTKNGSQMAFVTAADQTGNIDLTFFPNAYKRFSSVLEDGNIILIEGRVDTTRGLAITISKAMLANDVRIKTYYLRLSKAFDTSKRRNLEKLMLQNSGNVPVIIVDEKSGKKKLLNKKLWLSQDKIVYNRLVELLGVENVVLK